MQFPRSFPQRPLLRTALLTACLLGLSGLAQAQTVTPFAVEVTSDATATVTGKKPTISAAGIAVTGSGPQGELLVGDTLTASYTFADEDADPEDTAATRATLQWLSDGAPVGTKGNMSYQLQASDMGKTITFTVQPHSNAADTDPHQGDVFDSAIVAGAGNGGEVVVNPADDLQSVSVSGNAVVGQTLTANPVCVSGSCGTLNYQWQIETVVGSGQYQNIGGETGSTYVVKREDQKRSIKVHVSKAATP